MWSVADPSQDPILFEGHDSSVRSVAFSPDGKWLASGSNDSTIRVSVALPSYWGDGRLSPRTQFGTAGTPIQVGLFDPDHYAPSDDVQIYVNQFVNGGDNQRTARDRATSSLVPYRFTNPYGPMPAFKDSTHPTKQGETGSVWGVGYDPIGGDVYVGATLRRHAGIGPGGYGAIYRVDRPSNTVSLFTTIPNAGSLMPRDIGSDILSTSTDAEAYQKVGKVSLGDVDVHGEYLYTVNLNDRRVYVVALATATVANSYDLVAPFGSCPNGQARPFALGVQKGNLYVGAVCSAENAGATANDLRAKVIRFPISGGSLGGATTVLDFPLSAHGNAGDLWKAWNQPEAVLGNGPISYEYVPMLTDLDFADNGSMVLGFVDRHGLMKGTLNNYSNGQFGETAHSAGDLLLACWVSADNSFTLSGTAGCTHRPNNQGPNGGEFFYQDISSSPLTPALYTGDLAGYQENTMGGLAVVPGTGYVLTTAADPRIIGDNNLNWWAGGVAWHNTTTGQNERNGMTGDNYVVYNNTVNQWTAAMQGKSAGLGDMEALLPAPTYSIGNRVWFDVDRDGQQDAAERCIDGVKLHLISNGTTLASTTTANCGLYRFDVLPGTSYQICVDGTAFMSGGPLYGYSVATANRGSDDELDNDGSGGVVCTSTTTMQNRNNHSHDIGVVIPASATMEYGDLPDNYGTTAGNNGARHNLIGSGEDITLGTQRDLETNGKPSAQTNGDDSADSDDEDGLTITGSLIGGPTFMLEGAATNINHPYCIVVWADLNNDGDFNDTVQGSGATSYSERLYEHWGPFVFSPYLAGSTFSELVNPAYFTTSPNLYIRVRAWPTGVATNPNCNVGQPTGEYVNGEVEDYHANIWGGNEWGDLPDVYHTTFDNEGAVHMGQGFKLGAAKDQEVNGAPSTSADGDDLASTDDEDGIFVSDPLWTPGATVVVTASVPNTNSWQACLLGWIDWNGDGDFADSGEVVINDRVAAPATKTYNVTSNRTTTGPLYARFRLYDEPFSDFSPVAGPGLCPVGAASSELVQFHQGFAKTGEVEDYAYPAVEFGDLPNSYGTLMASNGARHGVGLLRLGAMIDSEPNGTPSTSADGDDLANTDDEDGVTFYGEWTRENGTINIDVRRTNDPSQWVQACLVGWVDLNQNGSFEASEGVVSQTVDLFTEMKKMVSVVVDTSSIRHASPVTLYSRFRLFDMADPSFGGQCTSNPALSRGGVGVGEVEDYVLRFNLPYDLGDLPNQYGTLRTATGPAHLLDGTTLGRGVDDDNDGQPTTASASPKTSSTMKRGSRWTGTRTRSPL